MKIKHLGIGLLILLIISLIYSAWIIADITMYRATPGFTDLTKWGAYGDYFGGMLNPIFAFLSFIALLATIYIQTKELQASRDELKATREELGKSSQALEAQKEIAEKQVEHMENRAKKEDLFRMLNFIFTELNTQFDMHLLISIKKTDKRGGHKTHSIGGNAKELFGLNSNINKNKDLPVKGDGAIGNLHRLMSPHILLLVEMQTYLMKYEELCDGDTTVTSYFVKRYEYIVFDMDRHGIPVKDIFDYYTRDCIPY